MINPAYSPGKSPRLPKSGTKAAKAFFDSWNQINWFLYWLLSVVSLSHSTSEEFFDRPLDKSIPAELRAKILRLKKEWVSPRQHLREQSQFLMEVVLVRHVENFLNYLSALLLEIFLERPETLKSGETISIERVLSHLSMESLIRDISETKVKKLSYLSITDLVSFFKQRFNVQLVTPKDLVLLTEAIETRNISVHNRCIINEHYVQRTMDSRTRIGSVRAVKYDDLRTLAPFFARRVVSIDRQARKALKVRGVRFYGKKPGT